MKIWDEDDIRHFLEATKNSPNYPIFYLALFTGLRRSELLALRWQDVDFIYCQIYVSRSLHQLRSGKFVYKNPKSDKGNRTVALSPSTLEVLREHRKRREAEGLILERPLQEIDLIFSHIDGSLLIPDSVSQAWDKAIRRAGLRVIRLHDARHSHASLMLKQGIHPKVVQERLGHSSIQITLDTYSHVVPGIQQLAANRLDDIFKSTSQNEATQKVG